MEQLKVKIEKFAQLIIESENILALTGAGMSTESGIPDFRSPETGIWTKVDPNELANINSYVSNASKNLNFMLELGVMIFKARANKGHKSLRKLQKIEKLMGVLTQNIDGLHQKAHTENIVELHGNVREAICMGCGKIYPITTMVNQFLREKKSPSCEKCDGLLKPNAIFYGEMLDSDVIKNANEMIKRCDLLIILGSSLLVYPVAFFPDQALSMGAKIAIINIQETHMDSKAEVVIHKIIGEVLPEIVEIVVNTIKNKN